MSINKNIFSLLAAGILLLCCTPLPALAGVIEAAPGNMVLLDVTDAEGASVTGVRVSLYNAAGIEIGGIVNDQYFFTSNDSGIDGTELNERYNFYIPWNAFTPYVAPQTLHSINICRTDWDDDYYNRYADQPIYVGSGDPYKVQLYSYDSSQVAALTVPANQFAVYVDPKWEDREAAGFVSTPSITYYFNRKNTSGMLSILDTIPVGKVSLFDSFHTDYDARIGLELPNGGNSVSSNAITVSNAATEYVLCRLPLQQLCSYFRQDGNFEHDGLIYDLRMDSTYTSAILTIQSGAVINAVIPDRDGYVEFYLDKASREYSLDFCYDYTDVPTGSGTSVSGGSGFADWGVAANITEHFLQPYDLPRDEIILTYVPAGTYTLAYDNLPEGYAAPDTTTITVGDSGELQYFSLVLKDAFLLGDVNADKQVNAADAAIILSAAAAAGSGNTSGLTAEQQKAADVNLDSASDALDAALVLQYAAYAGAGGALSFEDFLK